MANSRLISMLIPSRARPTMLRNVLLNITDKFQHNLQDIEVLIRLDDDDDSDYSFLQKEDFLFSIKVVTGSRETGYTSLPRFWSELLQISNGSYIWLLNDDFYFEELDNLIEYLKANQNTPCIVNESDTSSFPLIHILIFEIFNRIIPETLIFTDACFNELRQYFPQENQGRIHYNIVHPVNNSKDLINFHSEQYSIKNKELQLLTSSFKNRGYEDWQTLKKQILKNLMKNYGFTSSRILEYLQSVT